jgi:hypothetical protein
MRRFEFRDGKSAKFWTIALEGRSFTVSYGKADCLPERSEHSWWRRCSRTKPLLGTLGAISAFVRQRHLGPQRPRA